jgi:S1-C subfamily serine protease
MVMSALSAVAAFPAAAVAQERQPVTRARVYIDKDGQEAMRVLRERMKAVTERRARLGVTVDLRASDNDSLGATLQSVTPGGPAAKAGLRSGDVITRLDGKSLTARDNKDNMKVDEDQSLPGLRLVELAAQLKPEQTVSIEYFRGTAKRTASLVTGDEIVTMNIFPEGAGEFRFNSPQDFGLERTPFPGAMLRSERLPGGGMSYAFGFGGPLSDLELAPLNPDLGQYFSATEGVLVINVPKESTLGLKGGDVILSVDGRKITSPNYLIRVLRSYDPGDSFKFEIMRNRARTTVSGSLEKPKDN